MRRLAPRLHAEARPEFYVLGGCLATTELPGAIGIPGAWCRCVEVKTQLDGSMPGLMSLW